MAYKIDSESEAYDKGGIKPPLYAWVEWQHYVITGDASRFEKTGEKAKGFYSCYVIVKAMADNGYTAEAKSAAERILDGMYRVFQNRDYGGIWETYCPEEYKPTAIEDGRLCKPEFVGWGGLMPIIMLIKNIIGLKFNAVGNEITLNITNTGDSGLENTEFCGGISVVCRDFGLPDARLYVDCEKPFTLRTVLPSGEVGERRITPGNRNFDIREMIYNDKRTAF